MKLYTEEQVKKALNDCGEYFIVNMVLEKMKPIELPSDEEIYELMDNLPFSKHIGYELFNDGQRNGFELGAKWMRYQIINQNK